MGLVRNWIVAASVLGAVALAVDQSGILDGQYSHCEQGPDGEVILVEPDGSRHIGHGWRLNDDTCSTTGSVPEILDFKPQEL